MAREDLSATQLEYSCKFAYDRPVEDVFTSHRDYRRPYYVCWYIRSGSLRVVSTHGVAVAGPGDWIFIDPLLERSHDFARGSHIISIHFQVRWRNLDFLLPLLPPQVVAGGSGQAELLHAAEELSAFEAAHPDWSEPYPSWVECRGQALFRSWLAEWHRQREQWTPAPVEEMDPRVLRIMAYLSTRISAAPIDFPALSREVGLSRAQINRIFKEATGLTPRSWSTAHCLNEARALLRAEELSIKQIAGRLGFFDASHFTKWFRSHSSDTPTVWRKRGCANTMAVG